MIVAKEGGEGTAADGTPSQDFSVSNGDLVALKKAVKKWNFKDEAVALQFALAVLTLADKDTLVINDKYIKPSDELIDK